MRVRTVLCAAILVLCSGFIQADEEVEDGIFATGDEPRLICRLSGFSTTDRPSPAQDTEAEDIVVLGAGDGHFDIVLSDDARKLGVLPRALRLLLLNPPNQRNLGKIVPLSFELDREDSGLFHAAAHSDLEAGTYHFCVEKPDFSTGQPEMTMKMVFFDCGFTVEATETTGQSKNTGEDQAAPSSD